MRSSSKTTKKKEERILFEKMTETTKKKQICKPEQHDWAMVNNMKDDELFANNHLENHPMFSLLILTSF